MTILILFTLFADISTNTSSCLDFIQELNNLNIVDDQMIINILDNITDFKELINPIPEPMIWIDPTILIHYETFEIFRNKDLDLKTIQSSLIKYLKDKNIRYKIRTATIAKTQDIGKSLRLLKDNFFKDENISEEDFIIMALKGNDDFIKLVRYKLNNDVHPSLHNYLLKAILDAKGFPNGIPLKLLVLSTIMPTKYDFTNGLKTPTDFELFFDIISDIPFLRRHRGIQRATDLINEAEKFGYRPDPLPPKILLLSEVIPTKKDLDGLFRSEDGLRELKHQAKELQDPIRYDLNGDLFIETRRSRLMNLIQIDIKEQKAMGRFLEKKDFNDCILINDTFLGQFINLITEFEYAIPSIEGYSIKRDGNKDNNDKKNLVSLETKEGTDLYFSYVREIFKDAEKSEEDRRDAINIITRARFAGQLKEPIPLDILKKILERKRIDYTHTLNFIIGTDLAFLKTEAGLGKLLNTYDPDNKYSPNYLTWSSTDSKSVEFIIWFIFKTQKLGILFNGIADSNTLNLITNFIIFANLNYMNDAPDLLEVQDIFRNMYPSKTLPLSVFLKAFTIPNIEDLQILQTEEGLKELATHYNNRPKISPIPTFLARIKVINLNLYKKIMDYLESSSKAIKSTTTELLQSNNSITSKCSNSLQSLL